LLIRQGLDNGWQENGADLLTGPAVRGDQNTIDRHLALLESDEQMKELYRMFTRLIKNITAK